MKKILFAGLAIGVMVLGAVSAQATMLERYLDSTAGVDAYYDTVNDLTWLRDVHHADGTFNMTNSSSLTWVAANAWATGLGTGWRLPTTINDSTGEMLTLFNEGNMTVTNFQGLVTDPAMRPVYWSSTEVPGSGGAVHYNFHPTPPGIDYNNDSILAYSNVYAFAVHAGDFGSKTDVPTTAPGDCDNDGAVTIAEVQSAINMFLGLKPAEVCVNTDSSSSVSIAEVQKVINSFLGL